MTGSNRVVKPAAEREALIKDLLTQLETLQQRDNGEEARAERDRAMDLLMRERDEAREALATITLECEASKTLLAAAAQERDAAKTSLAVATHERDTARTSLAVATHERDTARTSLTAARRERDAALATVVASEGDTAAIVRQKEQLHGLAMARAEQASRARIAELEQRLLVAEGGAAASVVEVSGGGRGGGRGARRGGGRGVTGVV